MRRRSRPHIVMLLVILLALCAAIAYLRIVEFTISAKSLVVDQASRITGKKVFAGSIRFDILKGLVLENVVIYDGNGIIIKTKSVSCGLIMPSLVSGRVIIPSVKIESPTINAERRPDGKFNLFDLVPDRAFLNKASAVSVHKISVKNARIRFADRTLDPAFKIDIAGFDSEVRLYLPIRIVFKASFDLPEDSAVKVSGEYTLPDGKVTVDMTSDGMSPRCFDRYYEHTGLVFPSGVMSAKASLRSSGDTLELAVASDTKDTLVVTLDGMKARADLGVKAGFQYNFPEKKLKYSGRIDIRKLDIEGVEGLGKIENVTALADFNDTRLSSDNVKAQAVGMLWDAKVNVVNFAHPVIDIYAHSTMRLGALQEVLGSRFGMKFPTEVAGSADLRVSIQMEPLKPIKTNGYIYVRDGTARLGKGKFPIEKIDGEFQFGADDLKWRKLRFSYRGVDYDSSGELSGFASPKVHIKVASKDLAYASSYNIKDDVIAISRLEGAYFNSRFSAVGDISLEDPNAIDADLEGTVSFDLSDIKKMPQASAGLRKMKLSGKAAVEFKLNGDINNLSTCYFDVKMKADRMSVYGLRFTDVAMSYVQEQGLGSVKSMRSSFYGGSISATARIDWLSKGLPYSANLDAIGIKLERLKEDTDFRDKDVSGDIKIYADIKGLLKDSSRLDGIGHLGLAKGRLWQLDLFKGAGALIFNKDFSDIVFTEGACDYKIHDRKLVIDNLLMKSDVLTLSGGGAIGYDRTVDGVLRPEIDENIAVPGTLASAVGKGTIIEIGGTLKEPRFKTKTSVAGVVGAMLQQQ